MDRGLLQETKVILKSLIVSCPHGMTMEELNKDYRKMEGKNIPYATLGFARLEAFLKSLTDTLVVHGSGPSARVSAISVEKIEHIDKLVSRQKNATRDRKSLPQSRSMQPLPPAPLMPHPPVSVNGPPYTYYNGNYQQTIFPPQINRNNMWMALPQPHNIIYNYNSTGFYNWKPGLLPAPITINNNVNTSIRERVSFLNTAKVQQVPQEHSKENAKQNNLAQIENNILEKLEENREQKNQEINYQNHQNMSCKQTNIVKQAQCHGSEEKNRPVQEQNCRITEKKIESDEKIMEATNNKIKFKLTTSNLSNQSDKNFDQTSQPTSCAENRKQGIQAESSNSEIENIFNSGKFKKSFIELKCENKKDKRRNKEVKKTVIRKTTSDSEAVPELAHNDIVFLLDYPVGSVKFGEKILPSEIPNNIVEEAWFGIFVTEVHNPYKFWFHLYKENHELDSLMQDIENYYERLPVNEYQICHSNIKPGQVCAASFLGMWHRAEILEYPSNQQVKVFFVDYGTVADINISNIKYLLHEFSTLRSQALRGCLAYIKPATHRWSRDATYAFLDMVSDLLLYAKATEVNYKERIVHMIITDTNDERDFQINDALIRKGHARFCQEAYLQGLQNQIVPSKARHFQEKYPTFDMIEQGEYPSFAEIGVLLAKGIDFEARQDENILPDIDENYSIEQFTKELTAFNISPSVNEAEYDSELENISLTEESIKSKEVISNGTSKSGSSHGDHNLNPFLQKSPSTNPFLTDDSCNTSVCSSEHNNSTETVVTTKDEYAQCDFQEIQGETAEKQQPFHMPEFNLCIPNNEIPHMATPPQFYNLISCPPINYTNGWQYMCNSGPSYATNNTVNSFRPPPGFEHVLPSGTPNIVYYK